MGMDENGFFIKYYELKLPILLSSYLRILKDCRGLLEQSDHLTTQALEKFNHAIGIFTDLNMSDSQAVTAAKANFWRMFMEDKVFEDALRIFMGRLNNGKADSVELLHTLISEQFFRLSFWKVGNDELNYRRFFTVNSLIIAE